MAYLLLHFVLLICQSIVIVRCHDIESNNILQGINLYRTSLNLTTLTKSDTAECVAGEVANRFMTQPCTGPITQYTWLISKCHLNITTIRDGQILPVWVPNLDLTLVLSIFTNSQYSRYMNDNQFIGIGIGSENNWIVVVVLSTTTPHGNYSLQTNTEHCTSLICADLTSVGAAEVVLTIISCIASFAMFVIHPLHVIYQLWKKEHIQDFDLYPHVVSCYYNVIWLLYIYSLLNLSRRKELYLECLFFSTSISLFMEMVYLMAIISLASDFSKEKFMVLNGICFIGLYFILWSFMNYVGNILGFIGIISGIFMYVSPIYIIQSDNSPLLLLFQLGCGLLNGLALCILACISTFNPYIAITNGIGALMQLDLMYIHISTQVLFKGNSC